MTTEHLSLPTKSTPLLGKTLFDVGEAIFANDDLGQRVRCNIISSIRTLCRVLERRPQHLPAALNLLRPLMDKALPLAFSVKPRRWETVRSDVMRAIKLTGFSANSIPNLADRQKLREPIQDSRRIIDIANAGRQQ